MRRFLGLLTAAAVVASLATAFTASLAVPATNVDDVGPTAITPNNLAPPQCAGINLQSIITGDGTFEGNGQRNLVLGGAGNDSIRGRGGNDCILGGAGDDFLRGDAGGADVCIGGPGTDTFHASCINQYQ